MQSLQSCLCSQAMNQIALIAGMMLTAAAVAAGLALAILFAGASPVLLIALGLSSVDVTLGACILGFLGVALIGASHFCGEEVRDEHQHAPFSIHPDPVRAIAVDLKGKAFIVGNRSLEEAKEYFRQKVQQKQTNVSSLSFYFYDMPPLDPATGQIDLILGEGDLRNHANRDNVVIVLVHAVTPVTDGETKFIDQGYQNVVHVCWKGNKFEEVQMRLSESPIRQKIEGLFV